MKSGFLLIDKPINWTSYDVVAKLRKIIGTKKIGHAGTLDPFATGLLIVGIGREATRQLDKFKNMPKTYEAEFRLGAVSDTQDKTGAITVVQNPSYPSEKKLKAVLNKFTGKIKQTPPMYSAKKIKGKKLYELARRGQSVRREPIEVEIFSLNLISYKQNDKKTVKIRVSCSSGTYIRTLVHNIGEKLGCGAYAENLRRLSIGKYKVKDALRTTDLNLTNLNIMDFVFNNENTQT